MKILHIAFSGLGGHGNVFFSMADADKEKQHQFEIIFFGNEEVREGYIQKANQRSIPWYFVKKEPGFDFASYRKIEKIIRQTMPDIIFLHHGCITGNIGEHNCSKFALYFAQN